MNDIADILGDYQGFVTSIVDQAKSMGLPVDYPSDHICYRVASEQEYQPIREKLVSVRSHLLENEHHGRKIAKFILSTPLKVLGYEIPVVELPMPSQSKSYPSGLEHIELVVGIDYQQTIDEFGDLLTGHDDSGPFNQPRYITFDNGYSLKYHRKSIIDVVKLEGQSFQKI